jgi:hypothetical protein
MTTGSKLATAPVNLLFVDDEAHGVLKKQYIETITELCNDSSLF